MPPPFKNGGRRGPKGCRSKLWSEYRIPRQRSGHALLAVATKCDLAEATTLHSCNIHAEIRCGIRTCVLLRTGINNRDAFGLAKTNSLRPVRGTAGPIRGTEGPVTGTGLSSIAHNPFTPVPLMFLTVGLRVDL